MKAHRHLTFGPLWTLARYETQGQLAEALGTTKRTIVRWNRDGVPWRSADRAAIALGFHPSDIWGLEWEEQVA